MLRAWPRLVPVPRIEGRLAATSLIFGELDRVPNPTQHLDRVNRHFRQQLIHETGHEKRYFLHALSPVALRQPAKIVPSG
jgi:hypothetical protein